MYIASRKAIKISQARAETAEAKCRAVMEELNAREIDRRNLEIELARLRSGSPSSRLDTSLGVLHDQAQRTAGNTGRLADSPAPARDGN
jgi:hypothetical protein